MKPERRRPLTEYLPGEGHTQGSKGMDILAKDAGNAEVSALIHWPGLLIVACMLADFQAELLGLGGFGCCKQTSLPSLT